MRTVCSIVLVLTGCAVRPAPSDLVLTGGIVWTGDADRPVVEAVALRNGRIVHAGSAGEVRRLTGPRTRVIELDGRLVVPGIADAHTHFMAGGFQLASVDLRDAATPEEFVRRVRDFAATLPPGRWITGGDWDHENWQDAPLPRSSWIDSVSARNPVLISRLDGHMALANTLALGLAGVDRTTPVPAGGEIVTDADGNPLGVLKDEAMALVARHIPDPTDEERAEAFRRAQTHALSLGVTMVHDMGGWEDLLTYRRMRAAGEQRIRIYSLVPLASWERLRDYVRAEGRGDALLRWGGLKGFVDGSLGSTTAWFYEPYDDAPHTTGLMTTDTAELARWIRGADAAELHVVVHAIGERANDWLLDAFARAAAGNGPRDRRFRIEHAQHLRPDAIRRIADYAVLASMQPYHAIDDGRWAGKRIGPQRIRTTYAFRDLLDRDARLLFGSDWTVAPLDPLLGIYAAVTRRTLDGRHPGGWVPEQKITLEEALRAYTAGNAYGAFMEREVGVIARDRRADLVVLSEDIRSIDPVRIPDVRVDYTIVAGEVVFERGAPPTPR
jgi:predicted amidohydrolase YtcJ